MTPRYCIWHRYANKVAVNLGGQALRDLTEDEAQALCALLHPAIRELVEIRQMSSIFEVN